MSGLDTHVQKIVGARNAFWAYSMTRGGVAFHMLHNKFLQIPDVEARSADQATRLV